MSARDDYPFDTADPWALWWSMCDRIDSLRNEIERLRKRLDLTSGIGLVEVKMPKADEDDMTVAVYPRQRGGYTA